jgi:hypothetical protein
LAVDFRRERVDFGIEPLFRFSQPRRQPGIESLF